MRLIWKLLKQHISVSQFMGFFLANLCGMLIILLGAQFYSDTKVIYESEDSFMKADYIIVNKKVGTLSSITGAANSFSSSELDDLREQDFVEKVGAFVSSKYKVYAGFEMEGMSKMSTEMFFESVSDEFVDVVDKRWTYDIGDTEIPIILPKNYLDLYNFGYAQSHGLPKVSEGILGAVKLKIKIEGNGHFDEYNGRIVGFSSRLNTILVPESFMKWSNGYYSSSSGLADVTRVIMKVDNPTDENLTNYIRDNNLETDKDKLDASKTTYLLKVVVGVVMSVGLIICVLAFYILMLSVFLLVQKNSTKLENLLLLGYTPFRVALPYQLLTIGLNVSVLVISFIIMLIVRNLYLVMFESFYPDFSAPSVTVSLYFGVLLLIVVSILNVITIRRKILSIWKGTRK